MAKLFLGTREVTPVLGNTNKDDWGESLQGDISLDNTFICAPYKCYYNSKITGFSAPNATEISSLAYTFSGNNNLSSVSLPSLITLYAYSMNYAFSYTKITSLSFDDLTNVQYKGIFSYCFSGCAELSSLYFPALTTTSFGSVITQFSNIFNSTTASTSGTCTIHFPSNLQSTISGLSGYPLFGGASGSIVLAFDLPATS